LDVVGSVFKPEYCTRELIFELLRKWNYSEAEERHNNGCLLIINENSGGCCTFIYLNLRRHPVTEVFSEVEEAQRVKKFGKEPQELVVQFKLCKHFSPVLHSQPKKFIQEQPTEQPFWF
jgi:hypothetical protein